MPALFGGVEDRMYRGNVIKTEIPSAGPMEK
jgi:hypothetical protein